MKIMEADIKICSPTQGRAEDFQLGVALPFFSAHLIFDLGCGFKDISLGFRKFRRGAQKI